MDEAASGAPAHVGRVSFGGCARRRAGSWSTWRPRPGKRWAVARRTPCVSSRRAHARLRKMCGRVAGETDERPPSGAACGGSAAQSGHQGGLAGCLRQVRRAQGSGATAVVFHSAPARRLQPCSTTLTIAVSCVAAPHFRSVGREHRHHHHRHRGRRCGRAWLEDRRVLPPSTASVASAGCCWRL